MYINTELKTSLKGNSNQKPVKRPLISLCSVRPVPYNIQSAWLRAQAQLCALRYAALLCAARFLRAARAHLRSHLRLSSPHIQEKAQFQL